MRKLEKELLMMLFAKGHNMAEEKQFENKIKDFLNNLQNTWFFKHWAGAYSPKGIPDILACINGRFVGIEVKASKGKASPLQVRNVNLINEAGGYAIIVYPDQFEDLKINLLKISEGDM